MIGPKYLSLGYIYLSLRVNMMLCVLVLCVLPWSCLCFVLFVWGLYECHVEWVHKELV